MENKGKLKGFRLCSNCSKLILIYHKERLNRGYVFCSKLCEGEFRNKKVKNNCKCEVCGKPFHKKKSHMKINKHHYCSKECKYIGLSKHSMGEDNHQYGLKGNRNSSWSGNEYITSNGYKKIYKPDHPLSDKYGRILEHRYVAEKYLATENDLIKYNNAVVLNPNLDVHHMDKNKLNNNINNLQILTRSEHSTIHQNYKHRKQSVIKKCKFCNDEYVVIKSREYNSSFCSIMCMNNYRKQNLTEKICPACNESYTPHHKNQICCSIECSNKFKGRGKVSCECDYCGNTIEIKKSRYDKSTTHFCDRECYRNYKKYLYADRNNCNE